MSTIAQGNTQADMPGWPVWMDGSLYANIGREHGVGSREYKKSSGFRDSPVLSSQADLESVADEPGCLNIDKIHKNAARNVYYLNVFDTVLDWGTALNTRDHYTLTEEIPSKLRDFHYTLHTNFVLTGSNNIHVTGHTGEGHVLRSVSLGSDVVGSDFDKWDTNALVFTYAGNVGDNTFVMTWGFFNIDLSRGGDNTITVRDSIAYEIIGSGGNDTIDIRGHGAAADLIDLRNGGNNTIHTEVWSHIIGGADNDNIVSQPTLNNGNGIRADLSAGGDNTVHLLGAESHVTLGAGNDFVEVTNEWNWNGGSHYRSWSLARIDLSLGGNNRVEITGLKYTAGPTDARITLGLGNNTIIAGEHTLVTILGVNSTGNNTITLGGTNAEQGSIQTGHGHTTINWVSGNYEFHFGSGDLTFTTGRDLYHRFVFDGSERTANDTLTLNNWRGGVVHTGQGHTDVTLNYGIYDFHLGSGSVSMSVYGHGGAGIATIYDADGILIVGRVNGQSSLAQAVHTFSAGEGADNLHYSLQLGGGVDKVQFYAGSGHYQITSSANADIFQLDFETGGTEGATFEVFDFKWGADQIMAADGAVLNDFMFMDDNPVRFQYMGEENGRHAFDVVAVRDFGAYDAGHVWMTVYSHELPNLNFL